MVKPFTWGHGPNFGSPGIWVVTVSLALELPPAFLSNLRPPICFAISCTLLVIFSILDPILTLNIKAVGFKEIGKQAGMGTHIAVLLVVASNPSAISFRHKASVAIASSKSSMS